MKNSIMPVGKLAEHPLRIVQASTRGLVAAAVLFLAGMQVVLGQQATPATAAPAQHFSPAVAARGSSLLDKIPVDFVENRGQWSASTKFVARKGPMAASFERGGIRLQLETIDRSAGLSFTFEGAATETELVGEDRRSGHYNFFLGDDPACHPCASPAGHARTARSSGSRACGRDAAAPRSEPGSWHRRRGVSAPRGRGSRT